MRGLEKLSTLGGYTREELLAKYHVCLETGNITCKRTGRTRKCTTEDQSTRPYHHAVQPYKRVHTTLKNANKRATCNVSQVVWFAAYGWVPRFKKAAVPYVIDHINGDPTDNRLSNLQCISQSDNLKKKRKAAPLQEAA